KRKLSAQPNAGMPRDIGGRSMYMASPEYMASYARHLVQAGARIIGGCCGTTPEHIKAIAEGVRPLAPKHAGVGSGVWGVGAPATVSVHTTQPKAQTTIPLAERSNWGKKIATSQFVTSVEIVPPRGVDATRML